MRAKIYTTNNNINILYCYYTAMLYTFYYCLDHDDGCLIKGDTLPANFNQCGVSHQCNWQKMGAIEYDGSVVEVVEDVRVSYERYMGGFEFMYYASTYLDLFDEYTAIAKDSPLYKWFETMAGSDIEIIYTDKIETTYT